MQPTLEEVANAIDVLNRYNPPVFEFQPSQSLDLRKLGSIMGCPVYVDVSAEHIYMQKNASEAAIRELMKRAFKLR